MLLHRATLDRHVGPERRQRLFEARRAVDTTSSGLGNPHRRRSSSSASHAESLSPPMLLIASSTF